jgi:hypothetical protein
MKDVITQFQTRIRRNFQRHIAAFTDIHYTWISKVRRAHLDLITFPRNGERYPARANGEG